MSNLIERRLAAVAAVADYMDANYPCRCHDEDCPGNRYEADDIVGIVIRRLEGL